MATIQPGPEVPAPLLSGQGDIITTAIEPAPSKKGKWQRFVTKIWDSDFYDKSDAERKLIFKLDCFMLTSLTLGWWVKNLDQANLAQAYVSGLKEDLNIYGNEYTYMLTIYAAVVAAMQIPSNFIVMKVRPARFIACCELCWGVFTFAQAGAQSVPHMYAFRFCVAFFESFFYPVAFFLVGSWYTRSELAKRTSIWFIAGPAGNAFSGFMQAGIHASLNGRLGLAGWRWLYIICGVVTMPIGVITFFMVPDFPENTRVWYLTEAERQLARDRCAQAGIARVTNKIDWKLIVKTLKTWQFWTLVPWYTLYALGTIAGKQFPVYLRAFGYDITMRNVLPAVASLITVPTLFFYAWLADRIPNGRFWVILGVSLTSFWPITVLAFWFDSNAHRVASFLAVYAHYTTPIFFAWVSEICSESAEMRGFMTGCITCFWYATDAWIGPVIWLQTESPRFYKGFMTVFCASVISTVTLPVIEYLAKRDAKRKGTASSQGSLHHQEDDIEKK